MADFAMHGADRAAVNARVDQLQRPDGMRVKEVRAAAIIGQRHDGRNGILLAHGGAEAGFHAPDGQQDAGRHAIAALDLVEQSRVRLLQRAALGDDRGRAAALHERFDRAAESLVDGAVDLDRIRGVGGAGQSREALFLDACRLGLLGEIRPSILQIRRRCCRTAAACAAAASSRGQRPPQQLTFLGKKCHAVLLSCPNHVPKADLPAKRMLVTAL